MPVQCRMENLHKIENPCVCEAFSEHPLLGSGLAFPKK